MVDDRVMVDDRGRQTFERIGYIASSMRRGTINYDDASARPLLIADCLEKTILIRKNLAPLKRTRRTDDNVFAEPFKRGGEGKLTPDTVAVRLFMPDHDEFLAFPDKVD
jgi:hypothetical protein